MRVIQHTDRNLLSWPTLGIRFTVNAFAFMADSVVLVGRSFMSRCARAFPERSQPGCAIPRNVRRSRAGRLGSAPPP